MAPSSSIASDEAIPQRARSKSDTEIDYSSSKTSTTENSTEHCSSGTQTDTSFDDASSIEPTAVTIDGTHDILDQSAEDYEAIGTDELSIVENAQAIFSPSACIFVANLDRTRTRTELADEVKNTFEQVGECWVKVRFDKKNIPAAFVQYKTIEEAMEADAHFHGVRISGRPCRIKYARAPRTVFVARRDQQPLYPPEAMHYLRPFGRVDHWWTPCHTERALYNLPAGAFFRFELFQPCQEALRALRNHETLNFTLAQLEKRKPAITSYNTILPQVVPNAIYVGDLPYHIDENTLRLIFSVYGRISNVEIRKTFSKGIAFAFIYYEKSNAAVMACQFPYAYVSGEHLSRVEPKRKRHTPPPTQPQIYNYFDDMDGDMPFSPGGRDYTYMPGDPSYTPRYMRGNWPPY
ncbi:hypothetical protein QM012_000143 [Aureobasidium pullulans]|uniref:RRM domain-containing protein n=1 Tax=Aureobasidium pullulans TaxID=5580 RepID=A0ABR0TWM5_AURPU